MKAILNYVKNQLLRQKEAENYVKFQLFNHKTIVNPKLRTIKHANSKFKFQFERFKSIELNFFVKKSKNIIKNCKKK